MDSRATESEILENKLLDPSAVPISLPLYFLKSITHNFCNDQELGRGGYGVVYKGFLRCGIIIAVKKLFDIHLVEDNDRFQKELTFLMGIKHQNVVQLLGYCAESRWEMTKLSNGNYVLAQIPASLLCFEYLCNRGLDKHVSDESSGLEWNMRYEIIKGICSGLHFLHECNIVHLDLKPQNILLDDTMMPKIADFGLSRLLGEQKSRTVTLKIVGSFGYMAPEYINQGIISPKADIFSLGVIIIEILTGRRDYPQSIVHSFQHFCETNSPQSTDETYFQPFTESVLGSWRNRFERASKYTALEIHTQQVKQCIAIALQCVNPDLKKRPNTLDIIEILNAAEKSCCVRNGKDSLVYQKEGVPPLDMHCEDGLVVVLNTSSVRKDHAPARINEDTSKKEATGRAAGCEVVHLELGTGNKNYQRQRDASCTCSKVSGGPESSKLLGGQPLQLNLTNNTDERVSFRLLTKNEHFVGPLSGVVPPRCTLAVTLQNQQPKRRPCWRWRLPSNNNKQERRGMLTIMWVLAALRRWCFYMAAGLLAAGSFGPEAMLLILWSFFVSMTSLSCCLCALFCLGSASTVIRYMGYTRGLCIVGLFGTFIMWTYGYFWIAGTLLVAAAGMFRSTSVLTVKCSVPSGAFRGLPRCCIYCLQYARVVVPVLTAYAIYCVAVRVGWPGVLLTVNLYLLTIHLLNMLRPGDYRSTEQRQSEDTEDSDPAPDSEPENFFDCEPDILFDNEPEALSSDPYYSAPTQDLLHVQKEGSPSNIVKSDSVSVDTMHRIMYAVTHYEVLGIPRDRSIDQKILKTEYHRRVLLIHPDKNMENPLACESFKKLQSAYEVLSDFTKKSSYDEQLRKEELRKITQSLRSPFSPQVGLEFLSEESRRIQCTKCGDFHLWVCTRRSKARARFCEDCYQYHQARDGDGWVECAFSTSSKTESPRAFVCLEGKILDVSEWATCQGIMECKPNTHRPSFWVNMVGIDKMSQKSNSCQDSVSWDDENIHEDEFELRLQRALRSDVLSACPTNMIGIDMASTSRSSIDSWSEFGRLQNSWSDPSRNDDAVTVSGSAMPHQMQEPDDENFSSPSHELENPGVDANIHDRLITDTEALREAELYKKKAYEESTKRLRAERDTISALRKAKEIEESLYQHEIRQRKTTEETHVRQAQEIEEMETRHHAISNELRGVKEQKFELEQQIKEMVSVIKDCQEKMMANKHLLDALQTDNEKLQQERDAAVAETLNTEFSYFELEQATQGFDEGLKIGEGGFGSVYKGFLRNTTVAIKLLNPQSLQGQSEFNQEVAVLGRVRHPNLVTLIGSCREALGLVYEFLPNGSLEDRLACINNTPPLPWQVRTKIICEMCSALVFLHSNQPHPVVHGDLKPDNILLDANFVGKLGDFGIRRLLSQSNTAMSNTTKLHRTTTQKGTLAYMDPEFLSTGELTPRSDVYSFGIIILRLLTGRPPNRIAEVVEDAMERGELHAILDPTAGSWPCVQAKQLAHIGLRCAEMSRRQRPDLAREMWKVVEPLMKAASLTAGWLSFAPSLDNAHAPSYFVCPIFQEVMSDPHIAADGFTYEAEAIKGWLDSGHDTSPVTNLKLKHRELTPNIALRSAILEWQQQQLQRRA